MKKNKISVIIPTLSPSKDNSRLLRTINSVEQQLIPSEYEVEIVLGIDQGANPTINQTTFAFPLHIAKSPKNNQAAALNAALSMARGSVIAFIEDDDRWSRFFLSYALKLITKADFITTNQIEVNTQEQIVGILDFPTPSGWVVLTTA
mgnify:FL=1